MTLRLQQLVAGWQGAERNQPLIDLHNECLNAAGSGGRRLLPVRLLLVKGLDETHMQAALRGLNGKARDTRLRFRVKLVGHFDSVLVPTGPVGEAPDCWLLTIEENLAIHNQLALHAHALEYLLLINNLIKMGRLPDPDPRDGYAHSDMLAKLRIDALLRAEASLPIAVVQTIHAGEAHEDVILRLKEYAHNRLAVPFAYLLDNGGNP